ncbi:aldose 1-epimerase [Acinetobacter sp. ME22]|uniref:aldose 1-epimerase n=1 Tax=Acinetobacter sp. ME22 TaxID=2904802 RepID=UPI001EDC9075|nr:aldose 1-epimerase [Acinetobacter sp. ME22]MCG2573713.1 aldose 1-epimerase [Acinetobacter sp. ME22]
MLNLIRLEDKYTELAIAPELGGAIVSWQRRHDGLNFLRPLPVDTSALTARQLGAFALIPWSNRIDQGGISTPAGWFPLPANTANSPFAMHGSTWQEVWQVIESSKQHVILECYSQQPVELRARQRIQLENGKLQLQFEVEHLDSRPFWHGYGWHPFFIRTAATQVLSPCKTLWQSDAQGLSVQQIQIPETWDFSKLTPLPNEQIDHAFSGWSGQSIIHQPDHDYQLCLSCPDVDHLIFYCPTQQPFFCLEPVSHPINAHHFPDHLGLSLLQQHQQLSWQVSVQYQSLS